MEQSRRTRQQAKQLSLGETISPGDILTEDMPYIGMHLQNIGNNTTSKRIKDNCARAARQIMAAK